MHGADRGHREELKREITVRDGVDGVAGGFPEAERLGRHVSVNGEAGAGECCGADRAFVEVVDGMADPLAVAAEHFHVGHAVMAEGHRLGGLQMGEARHYGVGVLFGTIEEGEDQVGQQLFGFGQLFLDPEAEVERHLVVARAGRVQASGGRTDQRRKARLDVHVDVFELAGELETAAFDL